MKEIIINAYPVDGENLLPNFRKTSFVICNGQELQNSFNALQRELQNGIESLSTEKLQQPASFIPGKDTGDTIGSLLDTILWHEAYHAGQLGIIRRVVGKPGVIKNPAGE